MVVAGQTDACRESFVTQDLRDPDAFLLVTNAQWPPELFKELIHFVGAE